MIQYALKCARGHSFDAWFRSGDAFDTLCKHAQVTCPECGTTQVAKSLMAPRVRAADTGPDPDNPLAGIRRAVEDNADYVGKDFAARARAMHDGHEDKRPIYGEAARADAVKLLQDGVPIAPLPSIPKSKIN